MSKPASKTPASQALGEAAIDLLKLDIEGAERDIMEASPGEWLPQVDLIIAELHGPAITLRISTMVSMASTAASSVTAGPMMSPMAVVRRTVLPMLVGLIVMMASSLIFI